MSASELTELHIVPQGTTIGAQYYVNHILKPVLLPGLARHKRSGPTTRRKLSVRRSETSFQQDGAPAHTAKLTQEWCQENLPGFLRKADWSPNSPDLNPVENLWSILKDKAFDRRPPTTMEQLRRRVLEKWQGIEVSVLRNLVHSMPDRIKNVVKVNGGSIEY